MTYENSALRGVMDLITVHVSYSYKDDAFISMYNNGNNVVVLLNLKKKTLLRQRNRASTLSAEIV